MDEPQAIFFDLSNTSDGFKASLRLLGGEGLQVSVKDGINPEVFLSLKKGKKILSRVSVPYQDIATIGTMMDVVAIRAAQGKEAAST